jgi:hypothetical protein
MKTPDEGFDETLQRIHDSLESDRDMTESEAQSLLNHARRFNREGRFIFRQTCYSGLGKGMTEEEYDSLEEYAEAVLEYKDWEVTDDGSVVPR